MAKILLASAFLFMLTAFSPSPQGLVIKASSYGDKWPLTVASGMLTCPDGQALVFSTGGTTYAVNGVAESRGYASLTPIWRVDPLYEKMVKEVADASGQSIEATRKKMGPPSRVSIYPLFNAGLPLCG